MRNLLLSLFFIVFSVGGTLQAASEGESAANPAQAPFDTSTVMPMGNPSLQFNLARPEGWAMFIDPRAHASAHAALMHPATYAQFMQPQWWMQFADPNNMMAWMNPASYATFMNPATYMGWMNPAPYMHFMNPAMYMQWMNPGAYAAYMNPATYMQWMNPAAYALPGTLAAPTAVPFNWFDPNAWTAINPSYAAPASPATPDRKGQ